MPDWSANFKSEYDYARSYLDAEAYRKDWQDLVGKLRKLMGDDGFDPGEGSSLKTLRDNLKGGWFDTVQEDQGILQAVNSWGTTTISDENKMRAAALKFLRHMYLLKVYGSCNIWVHSLPVEFTNWAHLHLWYTGGTPDLLKGQLRTKNEHFSQEQKKHLSDSTQHALAWCQKASIVLAHAADRSSEKADESRALVRRWFAETGLDDAALDAHISKLDLGFKALIGRLNRGRLIFTDYVPLRNASTVDEIRFVNSEAFTFGSFSEGLDVVYIEKAFFKGDNVLQGRKNWTRILVHELTHLVCGTLDVQKGQARYAWYGIGPHPGYPASECVKNAENWAFFAADCGGALTDSERNTALKVI